MCVCPGEEGARKGFDDWLYFQLYLVELNMGSGWLLYLQFNTTLGQ